MDFMLATMAVVAVLLVGLILLGAYHPAGPREILDWRPARSEEEEVALELEDIDQMLEAQNERRRRDGRPELTEDLIRRQIDEEERERRERRETLQDG